MVETLSQMLIRKLDLKVGAKVGTEAGTKDAKGDRLAIWDVYTDDQDQAQPDARQQAIADQKQARLQAHYRSVWGSLQKGTLESRLESGQEALPTDIDDPTRNRLEHERKKREAEAKRKRELAGRSAAREFSIW